MSDGVTYSARGRRRKTEDEVPAAPVIETASEVSPEPVAPIPAPTPAPIPEPTQDTEGWDVERIKKMLSVPKSKNSIPTLTCIDKGFYKRYFILDVDGDAYREAWKYYKAHKPDGTPEDFVALVTRVLSIDMPRMYRAVSYVPLL